MGTFYSKVAGVSHKNADGSSRQEIIRKHCKPGMALILVREPDNRFDSNAIAVFVETSKMLIFRSRQQIGYLKADDTTTERDKPGVLARHIDNGGILLARVKEVTGGYGHKEILGVNIQIEKR